ncbi:MAG: hypothetical protein AAF570_12220, partial [Bacteroidota bacterium]
QWSGVIAKTQALGQGNYMFILEFQRGACKFVVDIDTEILLNDQPATLSAALAFQPAHAVATRRNAILQLPNGAIAMRACTVNFRTGPIPQSLHGPCFTASDQMTNGK